MAICRPLLYTVVMSPRACSLLMLAALLMGVSSAIVHTGCIIQLRFCGSKVINHYMCDTFPLLELSCGSSHVSELISSVSVAVVVVISSLIIVSSYALILINVIHLSSSKGCSKSMSTCNSHITTSVLF